MCVCFHPVLLIGKNMHWIEHLIYSVFYGQLFGVGCFFRIRDFANVSIVYCCQGCCEHVRADDVMLQINQCYLIFAT